MDLFVDVPRYPESSAHLKRAQLTQKLGARRQDFPRASGVLIPRALDIVIRKQLPSTNDRKRLGREIVLRISRTLRNLNGDLLALELPHPRAVLHSLPIEARTRGVLERLLPLLDKEPIWTVECYLRIPGFGARCLVDLLAACEESAPPSGRIASRPETYASRAAVEPTVTATASGLARRTVVTLTPIALARLDDVSRLLRHLMPIAEEEASRVLIEEGLASAPVTLEHVAGVYRTIGHVAPFRMVVCGQMTVAVAADVHGLSATVAATAVRLISHWGLSTVQSVVDRVGVLRSSPASRAIVTRVLVALPRLRWLDEHMEWFSLVGDGSRLRRGVAKIFAVAERVPLRELRIALGKGQPRAPRVPGAVLERYLSAIAECELEPGGVRVRIPAAATTALADDEALVADLLSAAGTPLQVTALCDLLESPAFPVARVQRLLRTSPLFLRTRGHQIRLVGHGRRRG